MIAARPTAPTTTARRDRAGAVVGRRTMHAPRPERSGPAARPGTLEPHVSTTADADERRGRRRPTTAAGRTPARPPARRRRRACRRRAGGRGTRRRRARRRRPTAAHTSAQPAVTAARQRSRDDERPRRRGRPARATGAATPARRRRWVMAHRRRRRTTGSPIDGQRDRDVRRARRPIGRDRAEHAGRRRRRRRTMRSTTESASVLGQRGVHDGRRPRWTGPDSGVAAGDADRHRLDERRATRRGRGWPGSAGRRSDADLGGDVVVTAHLVDVVGERRAVEHVAVDVAGDEAERGEEGAEDEQDACRPPSPATARRGAPHRARVARPRCSRDRQVDRPPPRASFREAWANHRRCGAATDRPIGQGGDCASPPAG